MTARRSSRDAERHGLADLAAARESQDDPGHHAVAGTAAARDRHHRRSNAQRARDINEDGRATGMKEESLSSWFAASR